MNDLYRFGQNIGAFLRGFLGVAEGVPHRPVPQPLPEPVLEIKELQGNILPGFNKGFQTLVFLEITEVELAKAWLQGIETDIATCEEVVTFNRLYKALGSRRGNKESPIRATWINIAFSYGGLQKLSKDAELFTDVAFKAGMPNRSTLLGDPNDEDTEGNCQNWVIGGPDNIPDVVMIVASDDEGDRDNAVNRLASSLSGGLQLMQIQEGGLLPPPLTGHEHFGFRDGVSQPSVRGRLSDDPNDFLTPRQNPADPNQGKPGQSLLWPGEFIFGYPGQDPTHALMPGSVAEAGPAWARNGSLLVFRKLRQEVEAFHAFLQSAATELAERHPALTDLSPEKLGAKLVGRWASGAPILRTPDADNQDIGRDNCANKHFAFMNPSQPISGDDPEQCTDDVFPQSPGDDLGLICPHAAHIRKANPREDPTPDGGAASTLTHRMLRRGIPFGEPYLVSGERGLLFLVYMTSVERQFEHVVRNWLNNPNFRDSGDGHVPIVGQNNKGTNRARTLVLPVRNTDGSTGRLPWLSRLIGLRPLGVDTSSAHP